MATVKIKAKEKKEDKSVTVTFKKEDYVAVKGTKLSTFEGVIKVCHKHLADKLVAQKKATIEKDVELEANENLYRSVVDAPKPKGK